MFGIFSSTESAAASAVSTVERGFHTLAERLKTLGEHIAEGIAHPFAPPVVKVALPMLLDVIEDLRQEVAELRKAPCEGCTKPAPFVVPALMALSGDEAVDLAKMRAERERAASAASV